MICVAIIVIVSSIITPTILGVRKKGMEVVEGSNLHNIYLAVALYEDDRSGASPDLLTETLCYAKEPGVYRSPFDHLRPQLQNGMWPAAPLACTRPETTQMKISYAYLRATEGMEDPEVYRTYREEPTRGMLASPWLGWPVGRANPGALPGGLPLASVCGPPMDGPILKINMDGSLHRKPKHRIPECLGCLEDLFK